jgi:iron complex outermembrane receptor protein
MLSSVPTTDHSPGTWRIPEGIRALWVAALLLPAGPVALWSPARGTPPEPVTLAGTLRDPRGAPVEDARIELTMTETPFLLAPVTVTATRVPARPVDTPLPTSELRPDRLQRSQGISLAQAVAGLPGVRALSTGEQIGKPVIRGLSGARVLTLDNGSRLEDYSWSDEDGPSVDVRLAGRIEVIRGPASVLYGSDALGGVVNVIPAPLPDARVGAPFTRVGILAYGASNNAEIGSGLRVEGGRGRVGWRLFGIGRHGGDVHTPDGEIPNTG